MAYQVTARKWRPQKFSDMVGQEHIARTLRNAIVSGRIAHAYLFVGPRGIGKTTSARIFAKALNCKNPVDGEPCCVCSSCKAISEESSVDVIEIDAATHTQVEKARDICEDVLHMPVSSKYKIYIIDEVHMLSKSAWNALLKTIEEPPAHAKFIFATTEVNKVLPTVISRCQRFDLCRIPSELITNRLEYIAKEENVNISRSALDVIARAADGGMRDAQSLLDQLVSFFGNSAGNEMISEDQALSLFGLTAPGEMKNLLQAILSNDRTTTILSIHQFAAQGKNLETLYEEILTWMRGIMLSLVLPDPQAVLDENPEKIACYRELAAIARADSLQILMEHLAASSYVLREAINKQVFMETILLKAMRAAHAIKIEDLLARLNQLRKSGELDGIEKIPTLAQIPVVPPVVIQQVAAPAAPLHSQTPVAPPVMVQQEKTVEVKPEPAMGESVPVENIPEETTPASAVVPEPEIVQEQIVTESAPSNSELKKEKMTENIPSNPVVEVFVDIPETAADVSENSSEESEEEEEEDLAAVAEVSEPEEHGNSMTLQERFSPESLWQKFSEMIREGYYSLAEMMLSGVAERIENSTVYVAFDEDSGNVSKVALEREREYLRNQLRILTGDKYADYSLYLKKGLFTVEAPRKKLDELKREAAENPMVRETADLFSGMIVDVFE